MDDSFKKNDSLLTENKISWTIRVFSSDNLCFMPDLSKEENEKQIKNNWEEKEPGRASLAKISRKRYILERIKIKGGELNNEDLMLLRSIRTRKITKSKEENQDNQNMKYSKNKKMNSKIQINSKKQDDKDNKKEEVKELVLNFNKFLPRDIHHQSLYIKN
jgi:hypothetical protein